MPVSLVHFGEIMRERFREWVHDKETLSPAEFEKKWPKLPTPADIRAKAAKDCERIRKAGGTPWQVWNEGYKGMGATIPEFGGVYDAPTFEDAVAMAIRDEPGFAWGAPYHSTEQEAWDAHDAYWSKAPAMYQYPDDPRRPPK